jgi:RNA polymerase sigma factor (sigma-70 family)
VPAGHPNDAPLSAEQSALAAAHIGIARRAAGDYARRHRIRAGSDDSALLLSAAYVGLCLAVRGHDPARPGSFGVYAYRSCVRMMVREHKDRGLIATSYHARQPGAPPEFRAAAEHARTCCPGPPERAEVAFEALRSRDGDPAEHAERAELREAIARLPERTRIILEGRMAGETMAAIGERIGVGKERVRQIIGEAAGRLAGFDPGRDD